MFACSDYDWKGTCHNIKFTNDECQNVPSDLDDAISSIGPDEGWHCLLYEYVFLGRPLYLLFTITTPCLTLSFFHPAI